MGRVVHWHKGSIETAESGRRPWKKRILKIAGLAARVAALAAIAFLIWYLGLSRLAFDFFRTARHP